VPEAWAWEDSPAPPCVATGSRSPLTVSIDCEWRSGLAAAKDVAAVRAAGITHLLNLTRSSTNCAEADTAAEHGSEARSHGLCSLRITMLGLKGEPYEDHFRKIAVIISLSRARSLSLCGWVGGCGCVCKHLHCLVFDGMPRLTEIVLPQVFVESAISSSGGRVLVHGATEELDARVLAACAAAMVGSAVDVSLTRALTRITEVQKSVAPDGTPLGLPAWLLQALFALARDERRQEENESLAQITSDFQHADTPQEVLERYEWRSGCSSTEVPHTCSEMCSRGGREDFPLLHGSVSHAVFFGGHRMVVETVSGDPRIAFIHNLCTAEEAEELREAAKGVGLKQSLLGGMREKFDPKISSATEDEIKEEAARGGRTSTSCRVKRDVPVSAAVVMRVSHLVGMRPHCSEAVQVVHYEEGQEYQTHNDWFNSDDPFFADRLKLRGQRLVSVFCYLCDVPEGGGGGTYFPELDRRFLPRTGAAALWWNQTHDTKTMDDRVAHCGEKPRPGFEKWGLNVWMRERPGEPGFAVYRRDRVGRIVAEDGLLRYAWIGRAS